MKQMKRKNSYSGLLPQAWFFVALFFFSSNAATLHAQTLIPLANDILQFSGGTVDPQNPDVYVIQASNPETVAGYEGYEFYSFTINRPQGATANYPVTIQYEWNHGTVTTQTIVNKEKSSYYGSVSGGQDTLTFAVGQTSRTLYLCKFPSEFSGVSNGSKGALYLFFTPYSRTRTAQPVVEIVFNNSDFITPTTPNAVQHAMGGLSSATISGCGYALYRFSYYTNSEQPKEQCTTIDTGQKLAVTQYNINHNSYPPNQQEFSNSNKQQLNYSPRGIGATVLSVAFLAKLTDEMAIKDYTNRYQDISEPTPVFFVQTDSIFGIQSAGGGETASIDLRPQTSIYPDVFNLKNTMGSPEMPLFFPRLGTLTTNKSQYLQGETVTLNVPFLNAKLYQKAFRGDYLNHFFLTLDGGNSFLPFHPAYDESTGNLTFVFNAPATEGNFYPEIMVGRNSGDIKHYPAGAFTTFSVSATAAATVNTTGLAILGLPENNRVFITDFPYGEMDYPRTVLHYQVTPANSSYLAAQWSSSSPEVLEITPEGELTPKAPGSAVLSLTSGSKTEQVTIAVKKRPLLKPEIELQRKLSADDIVATLAHNLQGGEWQAKNAPSRIVITHKANTIAPLVIDTLLTNAFNNNDSLFFVIPFDSDVFPRENSEKDSLTGSLLPVCTVDIAVPITDGSEDMTLTASIPVYLASYITPQIVGYAGSTAIGPQASATYVEGRFSIAHLDKEFTLELTVSRVRCYELSNELVIGSYEPIYHKLLNYPHSNEACPKWLSLTDEGDAYRGEIRYNCEHLAGQPAAGQYYKYIFDLEVASDNLLPRTWEKARSRVLLYDATDTESQLALIMNNGIPLNEINWAPDNRAELAEYNAFIDQDRIFDLNEIENAVDKLISNSQHKYIKRADWPEVWGDMLVADSIYSPYMLNGQEDMMIYNNGSLLCGVQTDVNNFRQIGLNFPQPDTTYTFTVCFPKIKYKKTYSYRWTLPADLNKFKGFSVRPNNFEQGNMIVNYKEKNRNIPYSEIAADDFNWRYFGVISNTDGDTVTITPSIDGTFLPEIIIPDRYIENIYNGNNNKNLSIYRYDWLSKTDIDYLFTEFYKKHSVKGINLRSERVLNFCIFDEKGNPLTTQVQRINVMTKEREHADPEHTATLTSPDADGRFRLSIPKTHARFIYFEVIADGYAPQVVISELGEGRQTIKTAGRVDEFAFNIMMRKTDRPYSDLWLRHGLDIDNPYQENVNMATIPVQDFAPYQPAVFDTITNQPLGYAWLDLTMAWSYDEVPYIRSSVDANPYQSVTVLHDRSLFTAFENNYVRVRFPLWWQNGDNYIDYSQAQEKVSLYVYRGNETTLQVMQLPGIINANPKPPVPDFQIESPGDMPAGNVSEGNNVGDAKKEFESLKVSTPSSLPFCIQATKQGNDWIVRGALQMDLELGSFGGNKVNEGNFTEKFEKLKSAYRNGGTVDDSDFGSTKTFDVTGSIGGYVEGKGTYNPLTGKIENITFTAGGINASITASVTLTHKFAIGEFGASLAASVGTAINFYKADTENFSVDLVLDNSVSLSLAVWAQLGFDFYGVAGANIGIRGEGWGTMTHRLEKKAEGATRQGFQFELGAKMDIYARVYVGPIEASWNYNFIHVSKEWLKPDNNTNPFNNPLRATGSSMRLAAQDYNIAAYRSAAANSDWENIPLTEIGINASPRYWGPDRLIYSSINMPEYVKDDRVTVYNANGETNISLNQSDNSASYAFDMATAGDKTIVAYEQFTTSSSENDLNKMSGEKLMNHISERMRIVVGYSDNNTWSFTNFSSGTSKCSMTSKVAISDDGSQGVVVWSEGKMKYGKEVSEVDGEGKTVKSKPLYLSGELLMSRWDGSNWSNATRIAVLSEDYQISDYQVAMAGDTVLVVGINQSPNRSAVVEKMIISLAVMPNGLVYFNNLDKMGRLPQIRRIAGENLVSFLTSATVGTRVRPDVYVMTIDNEGMYDNRFSGYLDLVNYDLRDYRLVADPSPTGVNDLTVLWSQPYKVKIGQSASEVVRSSLLAARLGRYHGRIFCSAPLVVAAEVEADAVITGYDAYTNNETIKAITVFDLGNRYASAREETGATFTNSIVMKKMYCDKHTLVCGMQIPISFEIENKGFTPISSFELEVDGQTAVVEQDLFPGKTGLVTMNYTVPEGWPGFRYMIKPTFVTNTDILRSASAGNGNPVKTGLAARTSLMSSGSSLLRSAGEDYSVSGSIPTGQMVDMSISTQSYVTEENETSVLLEIANNSQFGLNDQKVKVGLYTDPFGETTYSGTSVKEIKISKLYSDSTRTNLSSLVAFTVPNVSEKTVIYAVVTSFTAENDTIADAEPIDNYTIVTLYPVATTNIKEVETSTTDVLLIYPNPAKDELRIAGLENLQPETIEIIDLVGRVVMVETFPPSFTGTQNIKVSNLPAGNYIVKVGNKKGLFIKE